MKTIAAIMKGLDACGWGFNGERRREELLAKELPHLTEDERFQVVDGIYELYDDNGIIKARVSVPKSCDYISADNGWLSPKGVFYPCKFHEHLNLASRIRKMAEARTSGNSEYELENDGWIKVQTSMGRAWFFHKCLEETNPRLGLGSKTKPTKAQIRAVTDYCVAHKQMDALPSWCYEPV